MVIGMVDWLFIMAQRLTIIFWAHQAGTDTRPCQGTPHICLVSPASSITNVGTYFSKLLKIVTDNNLKSQVQQRNFHTK